MGFLYRPGGLVFVDDLGGLIAPSNLRNRFPGALIKRAGRPPIRFHDPRNTCATRTLGQGVNPKVESEIPGHFTTAITLDAYWHVLPDTQQGAVRALQVTLE